MDKTAVDNCCRLKDQCLLGHLHKLYEILKEIFISGPLAPLLVGE